jgi:hypothetical protein
MADLLLDDIHIGEHRSEYVDRLIQEHHYLDTVPSAPCIYRYLITAGIQHGIVGAAMWGKPVARMEDQTDTLELLRFWTEDYTPKNTESYALSRMIRDIDQKATHSRLIAYASTGQNHDGGIYKATNWEDAGVRETTSGDGWENRDGRTTDDASEKRKFVYHL